MKKGLKMKNHEEITKRLGEKFPELADLHTDQVRAKFSNLKGYFIHEYKKIQAAPSGSCGKPSSKWELFDLMSFLHDTVASQPTYSSDINEQVNPIDNPLVIEVTQNTFDEFQIGESSTGSSTQPVSPSFDLSNGSSDRSVAPATSATSSLQNQKQVTVVRTGCYKIHLRKNACKPSKNWATPVRLTT
ncbi:uncharacterized protein [Macrobrachium rosenbergii]|uniref:uncharacterized protein n=1 Tax=Macrobrachium rosenbergii TaxID=79674 RepID=UPI0034D53967